MKTFWVLMILTVVVGGNLPEASADWVSLSNELPETDLHRIALAPRNEKVVCVASQKRLFLSKDGGISWKRVFGVRKSSEVLKGIEFSETGPQGLFLISTEAVRRSGDMGKSWKYEVSRAELGVSEILCARPFPEQGVAWWVGTSEGLFRWNPNDHHKGRVLEIEKVSIVGVFSGGVPGEYFAITAGGMYRRDPETGSWGQVSFTAKPEKDENTSLDQFQIEEIAIAPMAVGGGFADIGGKLFAGTESGILESRDKGLHWTKMDHQVLGGLVSRSLAQTPRALYAATARGVFRWVIGSEAFTVFNQGFESLEMRDLFYHKNSDTLYAATGRGLFRYAHPDFEGVVESEGLVPQNDPKDIFGIFSGEPTIAEVQAAAIKYAEVNPEKILEWRKSASRKAWLPSVSLHQSLNHNENIDLDRGGTADPDRFIKGPDEKSWDWFASVSWDLGDLIWNDDQTSIDTRSKLMVELRGDILNEVTHLYYERRRLKADMAMSPRTDQAVRMEKEFRLQELTANIDGLTGGYFSRHLPGSS